MDQQGAWVKLDDVSPEIRDETWSLWWGETKSESRYFEQLLRHPLAVLSHELDGVGDDWHVITNIINHHVALQQDTVCRLAMVMPEQKTVLLVFYKHPVAT